MIQQQKTPQQNADDHNAAVNKAREKIIRAKLYKVMAIGLGVAGFIIAVTIYQKIGKGQPVHIIKNPVIILAILLPFVPGFFLAMLAKKKRAEASIILKPLYETVKKAVPEDPDKAD